MTDSFNNKMRFYKPLAAVCLLLAMNAQAIDLELPQPFTDTSLSDWEQQSFVGNSIYKLTEDQGIRVLKGSANASASLLYKRNEVSLESTPNLSWFWKIDKVFDDNDEQTRAGDDFPARVYVAYQYGFLPFQSYVINYVWASHTPKDDVWVSPFNKKSKHIALRSGDKLAGKWQFERRDVAADFERLFGVEVNTIEGIAIMVDADNTGQSAVAHFGAIEFSDK
jgi:hypothetical protein